MKMIRSQRRIVALIEAEIAAICHDAGVACANVGDFILRLEGGEIVRHLSEPILETLRNLAQLRRAALARAV